MTVRLSRWIVSLALALMLAADSGAQEVTDPAPGAEPPAVQAEPHPEPPPAVDPDAPPVQQALEEAATALRQAGQAPRDPESWRDILDALGTLTFLTAQWLLLIFLVVLVALLLMRVMRRVLDGLQQRRSLPDAVMSPIRRAIRLLILVLTLLVVLQIIGVPLGAVWAALSAVVVLIAVGFIAVWSVLSNVTCSVLLMIFKPFKIGDHVEILDNPANPGLGGRVIDVTLMYVVLEDETENGRGSLIQIPNNIFFQRAVRRRAGRRVMPLDEHMEKHGLTGRERATGQEEREGPAERS